MEGFLRVFASELNRAHRAPGADRPTLLTPTGLACRMVFLAGALTEVHGKPGSQMQARLADPTGVTTLSVPPTQQSVSDILGRLVPPVFVTVTGEVVASFRPPASPVTIRPDSLRQVDKVARDSWVIRTADLTLSRIQACAREEGRVPPELTVLAGEVLVALGTVQPVPGGEDAAAAAPDPRGAVLDILSGDTGKGGMAVEDIIAAAVNRGVSRDAVLQALADLVREDEVYQPTKGRVRLL